MALWKKSNKKKTTEKTPAKKTEKKPEKKNEEKTPTPHNKILTAEGFKRRLLKEKS